MIAVAGPDSVLAAVESVVLPPSERDFQIYRRTAVEGATTREAAEEFGLSQTRIMQIRQRVFQFLADHLPRMASLTREQRLYMAEGVAYEQLQHQYEEAMAAWRRSQRVEYKTKQLGFERDNSVTTIHDSQGDIRYLQQALRVSKAIGRQPLASLALFAPEETEGLSQGEIAAAEQKPEELVVESPLSAEPTIVAATKEPEKAGNHPKGDCSKPADSIVRDTALRAQASAAKSLPVDVSELMSCPNSPAEADAIETVQSVFNRLTKRERKELRKSRRRLSATSRLPSAEMAAGKK